MDGPGASKSGPRGWIRQPRTGPQPSRPARPARLRGPLRDGRGPAEKIAGLDPTAQDRAAARQTLLALLARENDFIIADKLARSVTQLAVGPEERAAARQAILAQVTLDDVHLMAHDLIREVMQLAAEPEERAY